jgi:hypothetical protein
VARWLILAALVGAVVLMLGKPLPIAQPMSDADRAGYAKSFQQKMYELRQRKAAGESDVEVRPTAGEVVAAMVRDGTAPAAGSYLVSFDRDLARGQFTANVKGLAVHVTIAGRVGAKDGYAAFEPTEFKIGRLRIPIVLVKGRLQQRLGEQREQLKLPDFVSGLRIEGGQLVIRE